MAWRWGWTSGKASTSRTCSMHWASSRSGTTGWRCCSSKPATRRSCAAMPRRAGGIPWPAKATCPTASGPSARPWPTCARSPTAPSTPPPSPFTSSRIFWSTSTALPARAGLSTSLVSFGFKHGIPIDADLVFDVRFLPNPHFVDHLRALDGRDPAVRDFIMKHEESRELLRRFKELLAFLLPLYQREGKTYLTVAVGCTGGRHRSVAVGEELRRFLGELGVAPSVVHRDLDRE